MVIFMFVDLSPLAGCVNSGSQRAASRFTHRRIGLRNPAAVTLTLGPLLNWPGGQTEDRWCRPSDSAPNEIRAGGGGNCATPSLPPGRIAHCSASETPE
jgi:hypothetical protein